MTMAVFPSLVRSGWRCRLAHHLLPRDLLSSSRFKRNFMSDRGVIEDPAYPGLFYHILTTGRPDDVEMHTFALSFLDEVPDSHFAQVQGQAGESIIGWLRASQDDPSMSGSDSSSSGSPLKSSAFQENPRFLRLLHDVVKSTIESGQDEETKAQAVHANSLGSTWCHIADQRNPPPFGRIPFPDDIIGTVAIQGGGEDTGESDGRLMDVGNGVKLVLDSYQPMPSYRLVSENKMMLLGESMMRSLLKRLRSNVA